MGSLAPKSAQVSATVPAPPLVVPVLPSSEDYQRVLGCKSQDFLGFDVSQCHVYHPQVIY